MSELTTITPNYQVHIPKKIREAIGLTSFGKARISTTNNKIIIEPIESEFLKLGGNFKVKEPIPVEAIRDHIKYG